MKATLVPIDGSQSSRDALTYAARSQPTGELLLLYIAPSAREAELECGRFLLEDSRRTAQSLARDMRIDVRLEVGDRQAKVSQIAKEAECERVVMGAHGVNALPHVDRLNRQATELTEGIGRPVVLVLPTGKGIRPRAYETDLED